MQVLWSRAAQVRSTCQCSSCVHSAVTLARRGTSAVVKKRKVTVGDVFTACYSSILATAAIADARVKDGRRADWDRAIADVKSGKPLEDLGILDSRQEENIARYGDNHDLKEGKDVNGEGRISSRISNWKASWHATPATHYTKLKALNSRKRSVEGTPEANQPKHMTREIIDEDEFIWQQGQTLFLPREPKAANHLRKMEEMIRNTVDELLLRSDLMSKDRERFSRIDGPGTERFKIAQKITQLNNGFAQSPNFQWREDDDVGKERLALHSSLKILCGRSSSNSTDIDLLVGKICYNLLICTAPPSIATYNILIKEFNRLKRHDLAQVMVDSFIRSKLKPNERTIKLILDHYISKKDARGFRNIVRRMDGNGDPSGRDADMHVKRRNIFNLDNELAQEWALTRPVVHRGAYLIEVVQRTPSIYESLIRGSLAFGGPASAIRYLDAANQEGQAIFSQIIFRIVEMCIHKQDYKSGRLVLRHILSVWGNRTSDSIMELTADARYAMYRLLALCGIDSSNLDQKNGLCSISRHSALVSLLKQMQYMSVSDKIDSATKRIASVKSALGQSIRTENQSLSTALFKPTYAYQSVINAIKILQKHTKHEKLRAKRSKASLAQIRWIRLFAIEAMLNEQQQWADAVGEQTGLNLMLYERLSAKSKRKFFAQHSANAEAKKPLALNRLSLLSKLEVEDAEAKARLEPSYYSVNDSKAVDEEELMLPGLIWKNMPVAATGL